MPKLSERQQFLREITGLLTVFALEEEDEDDAAAVTTSTGCSGDGDDENLLFSDADDISDLLLIVQSSRYLVDRERLPKATHFSADVFLGSTPESRFREMTRMDQNSFERVVALIEDNPVFSNSSTYSRRPIWFQLAVALDRFGNYGTGASLNRSKRLWGIGKGTVDDYTGRVVLALNQLSARFVRWPSAAERRKISRQMASMGFRGCVGFIDGTTIPLAQKPADDGECFFDRKQCYSLNAQVVCDPRRRIISFLSGWPGSCSDSTIYQQMSLSKNTLKHRFFSNGEYLLADSAYPADLRHNTVIPAYKSNVRGSDIEDFNTCVAHARVIKYSTSSITLLPRV